MQDMEDNKDIIIGCYLIRYFPESLSAYSRKPIASCWKALTFFIPDNANYGQSFHSKDDAIKYANQMMASIVEGNRERYYRLP
jgi:hypothetical protein